MIQLYEYTFYDGSFNNNSSMEFVDHICCYFAAIENISKQSIKAVNIFLNFTIRYLNREETATSYTWERVLELAEKANDSTNNVFKKSEFDQLLQKTKDEELLTFYYEYRLIRDELPQNLREKLHISFLNYQNTL